MNDLYSKRIEDIAPIIIGLAYLMKADADHLALEMCKLDLRRSILCDSELPCTIGHDRTHAVDDQFWFDVAEHINPDLLDGTWSEEDEREAQWFVQNNY